MGSYDDYHYDDYENSGHGGLDDDGYYYDTSQGPPHNGSHNDSYDYNYHYNYYNGNYHYYDDYSHDEGMSIHKWTLTAGASPVALWGLATNCLAFWVWHVSKDRNPVTLLFQCLAVWDNLFLLSILARCGLSWARLLDVDHQMYSVLLFTQASGVYTTLLITVARWMAVMRPSQLQRIKRIHILVAHLVFVVWCAVLAGAEAGVTKAITARKADAAAPADGHGHGHDYNYDYGAVAAAATDPAADPETEKLRLIADVTFQCLAFVVPLLVMFGFSGSLLYTVCRYQGPTRAVSQQAGKRKKKMTLAVLCIAGCAFLACSVAVAIHLVATHISLDVCDYRCVYIAVGIGDILQVFNSSVNFLFYYFFASKFRPVLFSSIFCLCPRLRHKYQRRESSTASSSLHSEANDPSQSANVTTNVTVAATGTDTSSVSFPLHTSSNGQAGPGPDSGKEAASSLLGGSDACRVANTDL